MEELMVHVKAKEPWAMCLFGKNGLEKIGMLSDNDLHDSRDNWREKMPDINDYCASMLGQILEASREDYPEALYIMGLFFEKGIIVDADIEKAFEYFSNALEVGFIHAAYKIGTIGLEGVLGEPNLDTVKELYEMYLDRLMAKLDGNFTDTEDGIDINSLGTRVVWKEVLQFLGKSDDDLKALGEAIGYGTAIDEFYKLFPEKEKEHKANQEEDDYDSAVIKANAVDAYSFFDKKYEIFDNEVNFAQMAHLFNGLGEEWAHEFREEFDSNFKTAEEALKGVGELSSNYLLKGIRYCVEYLTEKSLYTYDESAFYERAMEFPVLDEWSENFQTLVAEYKSIEIEADTQKAYREMRKNARARMIGGGFGFGGFVTGAITATIFNCATGILHSGINAIGNSITDAKAKSKKEQLFETLGNKFETEMSVALSNLGYILMIILHEEDMMTFRYPNEEQLNKFHALFTNLQNDRIPAKDVPDTFIKLLELNPYDKELYKWYLEKHGDSEELCRLADVLCINLNEIKDLILSDAIGKYFDDIVNKHTHEMDLQPIVDELDEVLSLSKKDRKRLGYKEKCDAEEAIRDVKKQVNKEIKDSEKAYAKRLEEGIIVENPVKIDKDKILELLNNAKNEKGKVSDIVFEQSDKDYVETVYYMSEKMGTDFRGEDIILCFYGKDSFDLYNFIMLITNQNTYVYGELEQLTKFTLKTNVIKGLGYYFEQGLFFNTSIVTIETFDGNIEVKNCKLGDTNTKRTIELLNMIIPLVNPASELEQICLGYENTDISGCNDILKKIDESSCEESLKDKYREIVGKKLDELEKLETERKEREARTYLGVLYDTLEERNKAENDDTTLKAIYEKAEKENAHEALVKAKEQISQYKYSIKSIWENYCNKVEGLIDIFEDRELDSMLRTVENDREKLIILKGDIEKLSFDTKRVEGFQSIIDKQIVECERKTLKEMFNKALNDRDALIKLKTDISALDFDEKLKKDEQQHVEEEIKNFEKRQLEELVKNLANLDDVGCERLLNDISQLPFDSELIKKYSDRILAQKDAYQRGKVQDLLSGLDDFTTQKCDEIKEQIASLNYSSEITAEYFDVLARRREDAVNEDEWLIRLENLSDNTYEELEALYEEVASNVKNKKANDKFKHRIHKAYYDKFTAMLGSDRKVLEDYVRTVSGPNKNAQIMDWDGKLPIIGDKASFYIVQYSSAMEQYFYYILRDKISFSVKGTKYEWALSNIVRFEYKKSLFGANLIVVKKDGTQNIPVPKDKIEFHANGLNNILSILSKSFASTDKVQISNNTNSEGVANSNSNLESNIDVNVPAQTDLRNALNAIFKPIFDATISSKISQKSIKGLMIAQGEEVLFTHDSTLFQSGKEGFAITDKGIYYRLANQNQAHVIRYDTIKNAKEIKWTNDSHTVLEYDGLVLIYTVMTNRHLLLDAFIKLQRYLNGEDLGAILSGVASAPNQSVMQDSNKSDNTAEFIFCSKCGNKMPSGSAFCSKCGNKLV